MREILFHGKRIGTGEWVEGSLLVWPDGEAEICHTKPDVVHEMLKAVIYPETVGQFTGLTDKNGKKIFEGDILGHDNVKGIVFYSDKSACFMLRWKNFDKFRKDFFKECKLADFALFEYMEVIGNIHDNPELLGGGAGG